MLRVRPAVAARPEHYTLKFPARLGGAAQQAAPDGAGARRAEDVKKVTPGSAPIVGAAQGVTGGGSVRTLSA